MLIRHNPQNHLQECVIATDNMFDLLPDEVMLHLIRQLPHDSLAAVRAINTRFRRLCDDYLFNEHAIGNIHWRLRFFRNMRDSMREDLYEAEDQRSSCSCSAFLLVIGGLLAYVARSNQEQQFYLVLAATAVFIYFLARIVNYVRATRQINTMSNQVEEIETTINFDENRLRPLKPRQ